MSKDTNTKPDSSRERTGADTPETCDTCGAPVETEEWHPTATEWDDDDDLSVYTFCSQDCRETWDDSRVGRGTALE